MLYAIYSTTYKPKHQKTYLDLISYLDSYGAKYSFNASFAQELTARHPELGTLDTYEDNIPSDVRALICLGGDGTILSAILLTLKRQIPIMGINLGQLGFMAEVVAEQLQAAISMLINENYYIDKRTVLHLESSNGLFDENNFALNEFTIHKRDTSSLIKIRTYINGEMLTTYWTDGLIVSTPTGSTGYNLSCGGPIVFPSSSNMIITPIAPHHLNARPVVVPGDSTISFELSGRADTVLCTLDSRNTVAGIGESMAVSRHPIDAQLLRFPETNFLQILHAKLGWGEDKRN